MPDSFFHHCSPQQTTVDRLRLSWWCFEEKKQINKSFFNMEEDFQKKLFGNSEDDVIISMANANATIQGVKDSVEIIKDWYRKQPHLPKDPFDDETLLRFYGSSNYSVERAKEKIDNYLTCRTIIPEFFTDRNPFDKRLLQAIDIVKFCPMPEPTEQYYRIVYSHYQDVDPALYDPTAYFKMIFMFSDLRMRYETTLGDLYVWDLKNLKFGHVLKMTPSLLKKTLFIAQHCYGSRIKGIYLLNMPPYAQNLLSLLKSALKKKIADRIKIFASLEELHEFVKPKYLPTELGGDKYSSDDVTGMYIKMMQSDHWVKWYKESEEKKSDESKRPEKSEDKIGDLLGITGSFRKLDID